MNRQIAEVEQIMDQVKRQKEQERIAEQVRDSQSQDFTFENDDQGGDDAL